jgi:hypothetical protein
VQSEQAQDYIQQAIATNWLQLGTLGIEATGDRIVVVQDQFKFGTECITCGAKDIRMMSSTRQASVVPCPDCGGSLRVKKAGSDTMTVKCNACDAHGWVICPDCNGTGVEAGLIAHPSDRERRPTTGRVVSVGDRVTRFARGESVIYDSFSGHFWDLTALDTEGNEHPVSVGVLREDEIISRVRGHLELRRMKRSMALHTAA